MHLRTERLLLREYGPADFDAVHAFASDPRIVEFVAWGPNTVAETQAFLEACFSAQSDPQRSNFTFAITTAETGLIGSISLTVRTGEGLLGHVIAAEHQGHGYATEASQAMLDFGVNVLGLTEIAATCRPENIASARVLERIGMHRIERRTADRLIRGHWKDSLVFSSTTT